MKITSAYLRGLFGIKRAEVKSHYEGANGNMARSVLPGIIQDAKRDLSRATRRELLRVSRTLWKNNPLAKAVPERLITYTVGTGIRPEPATSNADWNKKASACFEEWAKHADISSRLSFYKLQEIAFRSMLVDGDVFVVKTYGETGRPRIQLLEADQVGNGRTPVKPKDDDGVISDRNGRATFYIVNERDEFGNYKERQVPADAMVHFANIERPGQGRGAPLAACCLTTAIDLHDILGMEKACVKDSATKTDIIKTATGELPNDDNVIAASARPKEGEETTTIREYYKEVFGPTAKVMKHGDEFTPYIPARPSPAWAGFVDFLAELICLSYNLPPSMVRQMKVGGADTRRDLATMQRIAEGWQATLAQQWQQIYEYVIETEIENGNLEKGPSDWRMTEWQFPRAATVDSGRMAMQDREDVRTGNMTLREACGQFGVSWRKHLRQLAIEMSEVFALEKEFKLPVGSLAARLYAPQSGLLPGTVPAAKPPAETVL